MVRYTSVVSADDFIIAVVVITALGFDFTNGFHDTGNAMATSIVTSALPPRIAVALSGVLNLRSSRSAWPQRLRAASSTPAWSRRRSCLPAWSAASRGTC